MEDLRYERSAKKRSGIRNKRHQHDPPAQAAKRRNILGNGEPREGKHRRRNAKEIILRAIRRYLRRPRTQRRRHEHGDNRHPADRRDLAPGCRINRIADNRRKHHDQHARKSHQRRSAVGNPVTAKREHGGDAPGNELPAIAQLRRGCFNITQFRAGLFNRLRCVRRPAPAANQRLEQAISPHGHRQRNKQREIRSDSRRDEIAGSSKREDGLRHLGRLLRGDRTGSSGHHAAGANA